MWCLHYEMNFHCVNNHVHTITHQLNIQCIIFGIGITHLYYMVGIVELLYTIDVWASKWSNSSKRNFGGHIHSYINMPYCFYYYYYYYDNNIELFRLQWQTISFCDIGLKLMLAIDHFEFCCLCVFFGISWYVCVRGVSFWRLIWIVIVSERREFGMTGNGMLKQQQQQQQQYQ